MNKISKGFTIIELIVVIAIIAVLAAIVLVNVQLYIQKAKIAAIKGDMAQITKEATIVFANSGDYNSMNNGRDTVIAGINTILSSYGGYLNVYSSQLDTTIGYCACVDEPFNGGDWSYCVDSYGYGKEEQFPSWGAPNCVARCWSRASYGANCID